MPTTQLSPPPYALYPPVHPMFQRAPYKQMAYRVPDVVKPRVKSGSTIRSINQWSDKGDEETRLSSRPSTSVCRRNPPVVPRENWREHNQDQYNWLCSKKMTLHPRVIPTEKCLRKPLPKPNFNLHQRISHSACEVRDTMRTKRVYSTLHDYIIEKNDEEVRPPEIVRPKTAHASIRESFKTSESGFDFKVKINGSVRSSQQSLLSTRESIMTDHPIVRLTQRPKSAPLSQNLAESQTTDDDEMLTDCSSISTCMSEKLDDERVDEQKEVRMGRTNENSVMGPTSESIPLEDEYDKALKIYGWRMEIPGDPLTIKQHYLPKRIPYTLNVRPKPTLPLPPKMHYENRATFFQPTICGMPFSFTIHPDFPSEVYTAKMNALRIRGQWPYGARRYAFVY